LHVSPLYSVILQSFIAAAVISSNLLVVEYQNSVSYKQPQHCDSSSDLINDFLPSSIVVASLNNQLLTGFVRQQ